MFPVQTAVSNSGKASINSSRRESLHNGVASFDAFQTASSQPAISGFDHAIPPTSGSNLAAPAALTASNETVAADILDSSSPKQSAIKARVPSNSSITEVQADEKCPTSRRQLDGRGGMNYNGIYAIATRNSESAYGGNNGDCNRQTALPSWMLPYTQSATNFSPTFPQYQVPPPVAVCVAKAPPSTTLVFWNNGTTTPMVKNSEGQPVPLVPTMDQQVHIMPDSPMAIPQPMQYFPAPGANLSFVPPPVEGRLSAFQNFQPLPSPAEGCPAAFQNFQPLQSPAEGRPIAFTNFQASPSPAEGCPTSFPSFHALPSPAEGRPTAYPNFQPFPSPAEGRPIAFPNFQPFPSPAEGRPIAFPNFQASPSPAEGCPTSFPSFHALPSPAEGRPTAYQNFQGLPERVFLRQIPTPSPTPQDSNQYEKQESQPKTDGNKVSTPPTVKPTPKIENFLPFALPPSLLNPYDPSKELEANDYVKMLPADTTVVDWDPEFDVIRTQYSPIDDRNTLAPSPRYMAPVTRQSLSAMNNPTPILYNPPAYSRPSGLNYPAPNMYKLLNSVPGPGPSGLPPPSWRRKAPRRVPACCCLMALDD